MRWVHGDDKDAASGSHPCQRRAGSLTPSRFVQTDREGTARDDADDRNRTRTRDRIGAGRGSAVGGADRGAAPGAHRRAAAARSQDAPPTHVFHRDVFLDTEEGSLREQGITCRFRLTSDDRRLLTLSVREPAVRGRSASVIWQRYDAATSDLDPLEAARGTSDPARRLRAMVDLARLRVDLTLSTERHVRCGDARFLRRGRFEFVYDAVTVEQGPVRRRFQEMKARRLWKGRPPLAAIAEALQARFDIRPTIVAKIDRARQLRMTIMREAELRSLDRGGLVALVAVEGGRVACRWVNGELRLPTGIGSGEGAARHLLSESFGSGVGDLRLLGAVPASAARPRLEVWLAGRQRRYHDSPGTSIEWLSVEEVTTRAGHDRPHRPGDDRGAARGRACGRARDTRGDGGGIRWIHDRRNGTRAGEAAATLVA